MTQLARATVDVETPPAGSSLRVWGLSPRQLHDAYWRSRGVQCVRRGQWVRLQRGAELFLLLELDQHVLFNIADMSDRLTWHNAVVTRLRLINEGGPRYSEHVVTDDRGLVDRIERRYRPRVQGSSRVILTSSRRVASLWMAARTPREGWSRVRRAVPRARVDHWKSKGSSFVATHADQDRQLIAELAERWVSPNQVISGLEEIEPGVWHVAGESIIGGVVRVGPLWLGRGHASDDRLCIVGPAWTEDSPTHVESAPGATVRDIVDVELPDGTRLTEWPAPPWAYPFFKRTFDIVAGMAALVMMSPIMLVIAMCILFETGRPVFFGHVRQGRGGRLFRCWKFRTMRRNAHRVARELQDLNRADGPQVLIPNDPRVTRVGHFLRSANLDELPQFWNVLIGQMSLVGPRPSPDDENQFCPAWRDLRLSVRPGITGLWQLKRTREPGEDFQEWIKYDIEYVQRAGFWLDLLILVRTVQLMLKGRTFSAYE